MATFFVVFNQTNTGVPGPTPPTWEGVTLLDTQKAARFVKLEASTLAEAQKAIAHFFPGEETNKPIVVTEAQWKES